MNKILVIVALAAVAACSSSKKQADQAGPSAPDGMAEDQAPPADPTATADAAVLDSAPAGDAGSETLASCLAGCEAQYPAAAKLSRDIDACFSGVCSASCDGVPYSGKLYSPTLVDGSDGCTSGTTSDPIAVASQACADCVAAKCCAAWVAVFSTQDGRDLNKCAVACNATYSK